MPARHQVLVDANVVAAHFSEKTTRSVRLKERSRKLLTGTSPDVDVQFLIPNFCIAEVFAVLEKYRWGRTWNPHVKTYLTPTEFEEAREAVQDAIHNGKLLLQCELNRYHVLAVDLLAPINHAYQIRRPRGRQRRIYPAATADMLIGAMGIMLQKQMGPEGLTIVTGDRRLSDVLERAKSVALSQPMKDHLTEIADSLGLTYGPDLYPAVINLLDNSKVELRKRFPSWTPAW